MSGGHAGVSCHFEPRVDGSAPQESCCCRSKQPIQLCAIEQPAVNNHRVDLADIPDVDNRIRTKKYEIGKLTSLYSAE
jgi:hypothetical protein